MNHLKILIKSILLVILFFLIIENMQEIKFNFLGICNLSLPLMLLVLIFFISGIIVGISLNALRTIELKLKIRKLEKLTK